MLIPKRAKIATDVEKAELEVASTADTKVVVTKGKSFDECACNEDVDDLFANGFVAGVLIEDNKVAGTDRPPSPDVLIRGEVKVK